MSKPKKTQEELSKLGNLCVSIYPGYALIQGSYAVQLEKGVNKFQLEGFPESFEPSSVHVDSFQGPGPVTLKSTSFSGANLSSGNVHQSMINRKVTVRFADNSKSGVAELKGKLLSREHDCVLLELKGGKVKEIRQVLGFNYDELPEGLANTPSLTMTVEAEKKGDYVVHLFYKALSLSWSADYKLTYDDKAGTVNWDGSVFVSNQSGADFANALLKVVAGDAGQEGGGFEAMDSMEGMRPMAVSMLAGGAPVRSKNVRNAKTESLGQIKSFTIGKADVESGQNQKIPFFSAASVPVKRECRVAKARHWHAHGNKLEQNAHTVLLFQNTTEAHLGTPLPRGSVSILQRDADGTLLKSGGGSIADTALGEELKLHTGSDFDLKVTRNVADLKTLKGPKLVRKARPGQEEQPEQQKVFYDKLCEVELFNGKSYAVEFVVEETLEQNSEFLGDHSLSKVAAQDYEARVTVQPGEKQVLRYTIRTTNVENIEEEAQEEEQG